MSTRKRSYSSRSPHSDTGSQRVIDEPASLNKRLSTNKYGLSSIVVSKKHEIEEGDIELEKFTTSSVHKRNSQEGLSKTHEHSNFPKQESSICVKLSNETNIKDDSWKQISTTKHGSMEASKFSDKQNCEDEAKNERNSSLNAPKWEYEACIKGIPKTSSHKWGPKEINECHNVKKINTSLHWRSSKLDDESKNKNTNKSSSSGWNSWDRKEADGSITHKSSSMKWDSWPSDDIKGDSSRNSVKWDYTNDAKMLSNPKPESWNSIETKTDQSYMKDSHRSSSSKHRLWDHENKTKEAWKSSGSKWSSWDRKKADTNITQKSSAKWDSWPSDDIKADSSMDNAKWGSEINAKDGNKYFNPKLEPMNSKETKKDQSCTKDSHKSSSSKWGSKTIHRDTKKSSCPKWGSLDSKKIDSNSSGFSWSSTKRNINSLPNDSRWVAETNAVEAVKSSGPEWSSWDSKKSESDSSWYVSKWISEIHLEDTNISSSQKLSSWESKESNIKSTLDDPKPVTETNAKDAHTFSVLKLDSSNYSEAKTNSNWDSCNLRGSDTNSSWDRFVVKINPKDADKSSSLGWGSWDTNENKLNATLPCTDISKCNSRQGGSKAPTDRWNSQRSSTTSWNDSKWRRETNTKNTPKWGKSSIDERAPHSARNNSNNGRHFDETETKKRKSSGSKSEDHRQNISASVYSDNCIGTGSKQSSCRDHIDEKTHSKLSQNDSKWGSWSDIKDSKTRNVSSWSGPKWGDRTAKNEGNSECKKDESNSAIPVNCFRQREGDTGKGICCLPNNTQKTSENRNGYAMNNEMSASCEVFQKTIPSGMHVLNNEAFGYDHHDMKFFGHRSNGYVIEHTEDNQVKENDQNKMLPPNESQKQSFHADLHNEAKNITQYLAKPVALDPHHPKNKDAVETLNIWVQSSSAAGASSINQSTEACGTKIIDGKKEDNGILMLKSAVADFVKVILKPYWKGGHLNTEDHKTIVRKVVCKVMGSLEENIIPVTEKYIEDYMAYNQIKLTNLVAAYLDIFQATQAAKKMEVTNIP